MPDALDRWRDACFAEFPIARKVNAALRTERTDPLFFFKRSSHPDLKGTWLVLGRLGPELEATLSVRGEILFVFSPHEDFQRRSFQAIVDHARDELAQYQREHFGTVRYAPDHNVTVLHCEDDSALLNVTAWNDDAPKHPVAVLPRLAPEHQLAARDIRSAICQVMASRDLYSGKNPVTGSDFFGRGALINSLNADLRAGRSVGLFGLRRSGKTSVLKEMRRRASPTGVITVFTDLEVLDNVKAAVPQLAAALVSELRGHKEQGNEVWIGPEADHHPDSFATLANRLLRVAERNRQAKIVLAIDEIEILRNFTLTSLAVEMEVRGFLACLRSACQAAQNISLLFTGLTTEFFEQSKLHHGSDNPLFGFVTPYFLQQFSKDETAALLRKLGSLMLLDWDTDALETVHRMSGGFPYFARDLASQVRAVALNDAARADASADRTPIWRSDVDRAGISWTGSAAQNWRGILETLESYQPEMATLMSCSSDADLNEWISAGADLRSAADGLVRLGFLVCDENGRYLRADCLQELARHGSKDTLKLQQLQARRGSGDRIQELLAKPEHHQLEMKATARCNLHTGKADERMESAVVKTVCAFLNSGGGTLLIGIDDDRTVRGISEDLQFCRGNLDAYQRWLCGDLLGNRLGVATVTDHVTYIEHTVDGLTIIELSVTPCLDQLVWDRKTPGAEQLFVRNGNETRQVSGMEVINFARQRDPRGDIRARSL